MKKGPLAIAQELERPPSAVNLSERRAPARRLVDALWRLAIRAAYRLARIWWFLRRPSHRGALVALWHDGRILMLRSSYRRRLNLPGGGVAHGEDPRAAALRELAEETGLVLAPAALREAHRCRHIWEHRDDEVTIFEAELATRPRLALDHREIVAAAFRDPAGLQPDEIAPPVAEYLARRAALSRSPAAPPGSPRNRRAPRRRR